MAVLFGVAGDEMNVENPIRMVRELKGAPLSILFALTIVQQRVSQAWLEGVTGYTDKTISTALSYLEEVGLADHTSAGWKLTGAAKQLPLPLQLEDPEPRRHEDHEEDQEQEINSDDSCQGRNNSDSPIIIITKESIKEEDSNNNNNKGGPGGDGGRKNSDSGREEHASGRASHDSEVLNALARAGIVGKKRLSLANNPSVTVESVENWEEQLRRERGERYKPGLLISVLEGGGRAPVKKKPDLIMCPSCHVYPCECEEEE